MKSLMQFARTVLHELGELGGTDTQRDWTTVQSRVEHEGISFLTITLPAFGQDFIEALDQGQIAPIHFQSFSKVKGLPRFLSGFLELVFHSDGSLRTDPDVQAIWSVHQFCKLFSKIELECSPKRVAAAFDQFVKTEEELAFTDLTLSLERRQEFRLMFWKLFGDVLDRMNQDVRSYALRPKHGPGATANGILGNQKYSCYEYTGRLESVFPFGEYFTTSWPIWRDMVAPHSSYLEPWNEIPVRVISVPKTLKTPRIIAIEPSYMQYMQQGLLDSWERAVADDLIASQLVQTRTQIPNQEFAREGSLFGSLATLDLKEASDRVLNSLVMDVLQPWPDLRDGVDACRSWRADVPGHGVITLTKFASMGSALCFPMEAMVFCTAVFLGYQKQVGHRLSRAEILNLCASTQVYGDDIIVPVDSVPFVIESLESIGALVNRSKSYWTGKFRESCGKDYYAGRDISPIKARAVIPKSRTDVSELVSWVSTRNLLFERGLFESAAFIDKIVERLIPFPYLESTSPGLGRIGGTPHGEKLDTMHRPVTRAVVVRPTIPENSLSDWGALRKCLAQRSDMQVTDAKHLTRSGRPVSVALTTRWVPLR